MKKIAFLPFILLLSVLASFIEIPSNKNTTTEKEIKLLQIKQKKNLKFVLDVTKSTISWKGYKLVKSDLSSHNGISKIKEGNFTVNPENSSLVSGKAVIDMTSFESLDFNNALDMKAKLDGHLKSADFLDTEKFPTATFEITGYKKLNTKKFNAQISGNLTLKDVTKNITFKAIARGNKNKIFLTSEEFDINRQDWGIVYKAAGESLIKDEVTMKLNLVGISTK